MFKLPRLKVKTIRELQPVEEVYDFEKGRYLFVSDALILVEGCRINSYRELEELAARDEYRNREFIEVVLLPLEVAGGG